MKYRSIYLELGLTFIFFIVVAIFCRGNGLSSNMDKVLSISTFLFAIILGFSIANRKQRLNSIRTLLRKNDAIILSIYEASKVQSKEVTDKIRKLIDNMLIQQIDYKLLDFDKTTPELIKLFDYSYEFNPKTSDPTALEGKKMMMTNCEELFANQKAVIYWVKDTMMFFEWISMLILCAIIIICIYSLNDGSVLMVVTIPLLATAIVLLLFVLRDIDNLRWQEEKWIWNRLIDLFEELDLPPYLIGVLFRNRRLNKKKLNLPSEYRLVEYSNPYPNFDDKKVTVVKNDA